MGLRPSVYMVCVMPPPVTGMTSVSAAMAERFGTHYDVRDYGITRPPGMSRRMWSAYKHFRLIVGAMRASRSARPVDTVYITPDAGGGLLGSLLMVAILALGKRKLLIHHHVFSYVREPSWVSRMFFRFTAKRARHIVLCDRMRVLLKAAYGEALDIDVQSNASLVPRAGLRPYRERVGTLGYLSNISLEKGIDTFLEVAEELTRRHPSLDVLIAGPAASGEVSQMVEAFVARDRQRRTYLGAVYGAEKEKFYAAVDVLLFPTRYRNEAEPLVIFEAARYGTLVMATDMGCICEQIDDPDLVVAPSDDFVARAVVRVDGWINDPESFAKAWRATEGMQHPPQFAELMPR